MDVRREHVVEFVFEYNPDNIREYKNEIIRAAHIN
jgi:hypothetical protein